MASEVIDRSPRGFIDALCKRIEDLLKDSFWYAAEQFDEGPNVEYKSPTVHAQYLPVEMASGSRIESKDYPFVLVVCTEGAIANFHSSAMETELHISIFFGAWVNNPDNQGWRMPTAMMWRVMQDILANRILHGYSLTIPTRFTSLNSKEPPYFTSQLETVWKGTVPAVGIQQAVSLSGPGGLFPKAEEG